MGCNGGLGVGGSYGFWSLMGFGVNVGIGWKLRIVAPDVGLVVVESGIGVGDGWGLLCGGSGMMIDKRQ